MEITLSIDDEVARKVRVQAEASGTSLDQLIRDYLRYLASTGDRHNDAAEFERLSHVAHGESGGWKFTREEIYERR